MSIINKWINYSVISLAVGLAVGFFLGFLWFLFSLFILGYGDSGPSWTNTVGNAVFYASLLVCILSGQILFVMSIKKPKT